MEHANANAMRTLKFFGLTLLTLTLLSSTIYASTKHTSNVFFYAGCAAVMSAVCAVTLLILRSIRQKNIPGIKDVLSAVFGPFILGGSLVLFYGCAGFAIYDAYNFVTSPYFSTIFSVLLVGLLTLLVGLSLFWFRLKWRSVYGISEMLVGTLVACLRFYSDAVAPTSHTPAPIIVVAILTAGVYLVVRGADNVHQGLTKEPKDPAAQKFLAWLNDFDRRTNVEVSITMRNGRVIKFKNFERQDAFEKNQDENH